MKDNYTKNIIVEIKGSRPKLNIEIATEVSNLVLMLKGAEAILSPDEEITPDVRDLLKTLKKIK